MNASFTLSTGNTRCTCALITPLLARSFTAFINLLPGYDTFQFVRNPGQGHAGVGPRPLFGYATFGFVTGKSMPTVIPHATTCNTIRRRAFGQFAAGTKAQIGSAASGMNDSARTITEITKWVLNGLLESRATRAKTSTDDQKDRGQPRKVRKGGTAA